ncbi:MAG: DUF535 family protein [Undibacterium sp.]|uniref:DUF535 family protein n=1 Tax=Undibacterium sp. TaxID=1914977 RepID=UPI002724E4B6|nr:DUF535 family protein [Undibacterium sp.]MDO8652053.1 DUF535 family protein [Undibacterium sp.]
MRIFPSLIGTLSKVISRDIGRAGLRLQPSSSLFGSYAPRPGEIMLYSGLTGTRAGMSYVRESLKLTARASANYKTTRQWIAHWNSTPLLAQIARTTPCVLKKIFRPYLTTRLRCSERLAVLTSHYAFIAEHGLGELILRAAAAPVVLSEFAGKSGTSYQIELVMVDTMEREGELVLQLVSAGAILFSVALTFFNQAGGATALTVAIGCLQGGRAENSLEQIRFATRDLFGLRPKTLMVRLVQQIGQQFACRDLLLVGNQNRAVTTQLRKGIVFADYDTTWLELNAVRRPDGDFILPCSVLAEPDLQAIASSKRSEAKKRYALLSAICQSTCDGLRRS